MKIIKIIILIQILYLSACSNITQPVAAGPLVNSLNSSKEQKTDARNIEILNTAQLGDDVKLHDDNYRVTQKYFSAAGSNCLLLISSTKTAVYCYKEPEQWYKVGESVVDRLEMLGI